ncbi:MAG: glycosyltransferase family 2 protein [Cyanobacteria bacterium P01_F01_bin.150]
MKTLSLVLPCYNEAPNIPLILERFAQVMNRDDVEVILVDNGSTDDTQVVLADLLPSYPFARAVIVEVNQGYGYGILAGLKAANSRFLGWTHADMQTDPKDVLDGLRLLEKSADPEQTYVKGSRKGRPLSDVFFTIGMAIFETIVLRVPLWEINAQPNLFSASFFNRWQDPPYDFSLDLYCYYLALKSKFKIIRFEVRFGERAHGISRWNINWKAKLKFIKRTIDFTWELRRRLQLIESR